MKHGGYIAIDDSLGQPLRHGAFPHTGFAYQNRVVLCSAGEDLHDALDLLLAADDRINLAFPGHLGQITAELGQHFLLPLSVSDSFFIHMRLNHTRADAFYITAQDIEHSYGCAVFL